MNDVLTTVAPLVKRITQTMAGLIAQDEEIVGRVSGYSFESGGKKLRPLLFCLMSEALGRTLTDRLVEYGAAFEFLHLATLLHDDIVDGAETRRGRPAAHLVFSAPEAVLAGDYLLGKAAFIGAATESVECGRIMAEVVSALSLGELIQLNSRREVELAEEDYFRIIYRKTAVLVEGATKCAAVLAGVDEGLKQAAADYGRRLGLAFQIMDDILDYQGDQAVFGKPVGHDLDEGKITLPFIRARLALGARKSRLEELARQEDISPEDHREIAALVAEGRGADSALATARELAREAEDALEPLPPSPAREILANLARYTVDRNH